LRIAHDQTVSILTVGCRDDRELDLRRMAAVRFAGPSPRARPVTNTAILAVSALLLLAYLLDILGRRLRLPSVALLIAAGMLLRQVSDASGIHLGWVDPVVPILGTVGLILIVLEGAMDLELRRERTRLIAVCGASALLGFTVCVAVFSVLLHHVAGLDYFRATLAAVAFAVISSAIAIPSAASLAPKAREFVVYESSLSDILGVLVLYAWLESQGSIARFGTGLAIGVAGSVAVAFVASIALYALLNRLRGHVRFLPLLAGIALLYAGGKALHLSPLIVVLAGGLLLNNPHLLDRLPRVRRFHTPEYEQTLHEFKGLVAELTFATKSFFFLLLGYWTDLSHMAEPRAWLVAGAIVAVIYVSRLGLLAALRQPAADRLVWIAPRGLITVLLYLAAAEAVDLSAFPFGAVMLVVLTTSVLVAQAKRAGPVEGLVAPDEAPRGP
jgi:Kef-type K+ transport system membrane component KefB